MHGSGRAARVESRDTATGTSGRTTIPDDGPEGVVFPGEQSGVWTFDTESGQYYLHRFYHHQPDLNIANHAVRDEIAKVIGFWLAQGLSGFRVDAVPFLLELDGIDGADAAGPAPVPARPPRVHPAAQRRRHPAR